MVESEHNSEEVEVEGSKEGTIGVIYFCGELLPNPKTVPFIFSVILELDVLFFILNRPLFFILNIVGALELMVEIQFDWRISLKIKMYFEC